MTEERYHKTYMVTWDRLHRDSKALAEILLKLPPFKGIVSITRGGLVPSAIVARELDLRLVDTLCISSYDDRSQSSECTVLKGVEGDGEGLLMIDDLVDTGRTAKVARALLPKAHFATVYAKPEGRLVVDSFVKEVTQDTWILFPWDAETQYIKPLAQMPR